MTKLRIDWDHPLANGLIGCWLPGVSSGINLAGDSPDLTLGSAAKIGVGVEGPGLTSDAANTGMTAIVGTSSPFTTWTECSLYYRGYQTAFGATDADYLSIEYNNLVGSPYELASITMKTAGGNVQLAWNSGGVLSVSTEKPIVSPGLNSFGATFKVGGNSILYQSGLATDTTAFGAGAPTSSATSSTTMGTRAGAPTLFTNATCFIGCAWNRQLTAAEMALLDADPYGFLVPDEGEWPAIAAAATTQYAAFSTPQHSLSQVVRRMVGY